VLGWTKVAVQETQLESCTGQVLNTKTVEEFSQSLFLKSAEGNKLDLN